MNVIFTANLGNFDKPIPLDLKLRGKWQAVYFTDDPDLSVPGWDMCYIAPNEDLPNVALSKEIKLRPHLYFPDAKWSLWVDATRQVLQPLDLFLKTALKLTSEDATWIARKHTKRNCIYEELEAPRVNRLVSKNTLKKLKKFYHSEHFPTGAGLPENPVILRKNTIKNALAGDLWWSMMHRFKAWRDQIFLPYVLRSVDVTPEYMEALMIEPFIKKKHKHIKHKNV